MSMMTLSPAERKAIQGAAGRLAELALDTYLIQADALGDTLAGGLPALKMEPAGTARHDALREGLELCLADLHGAGRRLRRMLDELAALYAELAEGDGPDADAGDGGPDSRPAEALAQPGLRSLSAAELQEFLTRRAAYLDGQRPAVMLKGGYDAAGGEWA
jgi:hypothetical protein